MTRAEMLARIHTLQAQLDAHQPDPLKTDSETLAILAPVKGALAALQERLRRLDVHR
jgi:hypothetical protein